MFYFVMVEIGYDMEHTHPSYTFMEHENTRHATGHKNAFRCTNLISTFEILHLNEPLTYRYNQDFRRVDLSNLLIKHRSNLRACNCIEFLGNPFLQRTCGRLLLKADLKNLTNEVKPNIN